jgi:3-oxoacyl-[acyl-carrier-protein] synthase II
LAGGIDDILSNYPELGPEIFGSMGAYSGRVDNPQGASRPFDKGRDGIVIGSGGAVLVVEGMRHAIARKAKIYATILGAEKGMDGFDPVNADSDRIARLILKTLKKPDEDGFYPAGAIFAHATSTLKGDRVEIDALRKVTLNLEDSEFPELDIVTFVTKRDPQTALATGYGMGGLNATVLFGKY